MGTIKQGILGGFSGKVGTVVGSSWKGISYMRGQAQNVKNPRTAKQVAQRDKFSLALSFIRPIQSFIQIGFKTYAHRQSAFNAAMSYTLKNVIKGTYPSFTIDYTQAMVSRGSLAKPLNIQKLNNDNEIAVYDMTSTCRGDEGSSLSYPSDWVGDTVHVYLAFVSEDGMLVSDSEYVGSMTIE